MGASHQRPVASAFRRGRPEAFVSALAATVTAFVAALFLGPAPLGSTFIAVTVAPLVVVPRVMVPLSADVISVEVPVIVSAPVLCVMLPVVAVAPNDLLIEKLKSNLRPTVPFRRKKILVT